MLNLCLITLPWKLRSLGGEVWLLVSKVKKRVICYLYGAWKRYLWKFYGEELFDRVKCKLVQGEKKETWFSSKLIKLYIIYAQEPLF